MVGRSQVSIEIVSTFSIAGLGCILDEVMSGMGRTGTLHAWEQEDVVPDLQTIAKGRAMVGRSQVSIEIVSTFSIAGLGCTHSTWHCLGDECIHHVPQCYPYRRMNTNESTEDYVARLAQELEDEFQRLGP
jgi:adenosylmethionine-8-amino-7-oxononanoate aminotransferase